MKYISSEGLKKLKKELEERRTIKRQEIAQHLEEAKALGDLSENTEYAAAKEAQAFNEGRILELERIIKETSLVRPGRKRQQQVEIGSVIEVELVDRANSPKLKDLFKSRPPAKRQVFTIVGSQEADPSQGKISNESPLGQAFFGHRVNDIIEVETPKKKVNYKIVKIK
jgi:transcription elongation factor GreA